MSPPQWTVQSSTIMAFISSALIAESFHLTPSPVSPMKRPIMPSVMQRTNLSHGVSLSPTYVTHALAVLYRNSSLPIQREAFQVSQFAQPFMMLLCLLCTYYSSMGSSAKGYVTSLQSGTLCPPQFPTLCQNEGRAQNREGRAKKKTALVAVADVPGSPVLGTWCRFQTLTDSLTIGGLCCHLLADAVHCRLHDG